jgi:hypothetical protein
MNGRAGWISIVAALLAGACSPEDVAQICAEERPVQCFDSSGSLAACCPASHPVCPTEGTECLERGSAGSGGATGGSSGGSGLGGSGGSSGASGGAGDAGGSGTGGASGDCSDGYEPNETEAAAADLGTITDCDSAGSRVTARLDGPNDADFYRYYGEDRFGCAVNPSAETSASVRLCVFANCPDAKVTCKQGTPATSPAGYGGCCVVSGGRVELGLDCATSSESADVYFRVDQATACVPYEVSYHF